MLPISGLINAMVMLKNYLSLLMQICLMIALFYPEGADAEKIVISTDREVYIAGDRLWLSLQLMNTAKTSDYIYISLSNTSGSLIYNGCMKVNNNRTYGSIYLNDTLTSGIYRLVSYSNCMRNEAGLFYASKNILVVNRFDDRFIEFINQYSIDENTISREESTQKQGIALPEIKTDKKNYSQREKVAIHLKIPETRDYEPMSISVRQLAPVSFVSSEPEPGKVIKNNECLVLPERSGIILQGTLKDKNRIPESGIPVFLSCVDSVANLQHTFTNAEGVFRFFLNPYYFGKTLMIKSENSFNGFIEVDDKSLPDYSFPSPGLKLSGELSKFIENSQKFLTVQKAYNYDFLRETKNPDIGKAYRPAVYESTPEVVFPSDFIYLPDFIEISREILPFMKIRERKDEYVASILDINQNFFTGMYIFVDGILIEEVSQIIAFDSKTIRKIETIPNTRFSGNLKIPTIISLTTASKQVNELEWKYPVVKIQADSIMHISRYAPHYPDSISRHIPDFRQLLLWEPLLDCSGITTFDFDAFTSDCTGEFEIVLTCSGKNGEVMEFKNVFNVVHP
jgi:hypothetical protein